ncbi:MAG: class I SAM-dependent methyltransferase [Candidatus Zixiibacteriota bacterium]
MKHDTVNYYRARAAEYEQIYYREVPERRQELADEVIRLRSLASGKTVLELACGTGYWTQVLSETARQVTAIDISPEMLSEAKKKPLGCPVEFVQGDMFSRQWPDHAFDLIAVGFWFSHQPRQEYDKLFDLYAHCVTDNGLIWMIDNNPPAEGSGHQTIGTDEFGNNYKQRFLDNGERYVILKNYFSEQDLLSLFSRRFRIIRMIYKTYYWSVQLAR